MRVEANPNELKLTGKCLREIDFEALKSALKKEGLSSDVVSTTIFIQKDDKLNSVMFHHPSPKSIEDKEIRVVSSDPKLLEQLKKVLEALK